MLRIFFYVSLFLFAMTSRSLGNDFEARLKGLEEVLQRQQKTIEEQQNLINRLKEDLAGLKKGGAAKTEEKSAEAQQPSKVSSLFGGSWMTNPYISLVLNTNVYSSNINERQLEDRGIPGYTTEGFEQHKGFNLESAELFLFAPVDPYFNLYATIPFSEEGAEVEEAYFVTTSLPEGLQFKGGKFKSNFSRFNAQHPHAWDFADAPLAYRAFLGPEGLIEKGAQLTYLPKLPFYTLFGFEVLQGENELLFNSASRGGPHAFTAFAKASFDFGKSSTLLLGPSVVWGKTRTDRIAEGMIFRGNSTIYGFDATYKWKPSKQNSLVLQGEYLLRSQKGDTEDTLLGTVDPLKCVQDAIYVQGLYQFGRWRLGARYDLLDVFKDTYKLAGGQLDLGAKPWRLSGALEFSPSEFSRLRLQYNHDRSGRDGRTNHEFFLQAILGIGAHTAHPF